MPRHAWRYVVIVGIVAQAVNQAAGGPDYVDWELTAFTIILVIAFFWYEQRHRWSPFKLLGCSLGNHPLPQDPVRPEKINLCASEGETVFVVRFEPRIGGKCKDVSVMFQRPATLMERMRR